MFICILVLKHNKDNAIDERFNRTVIEEFMETDEYFEPYLTETSLTKANERLTEWLIFYNFKRPHQGTEPGHGIHSMYLTHFQLYQA